MSTLEPLTDAEAAQVGLLLRRVQMPRRDPVCEHCGKTYTREGMRGRGKRFCSQECNWNHPRPKRPVVPPSDEEILREMRECHASLRREVA